jgi:7,8-dihydro-6-hydroxymethylpterin-pyrophosphokinase|tara:strand:+ start:1959 stop:2237 length:279 start_codon:yes stop_codon:yes gene_type:complete
MGNKYDVLKVFVEDLFEVVKDGLHNNGDIEEKFESVVKDKLKELGFDLDLVFFDGECLEEDLTVSPSDVKKTLYCLYDIDEPHVQLYELEWY